MKRKVDEKEQVLRDVLSANIKKYRARRAWSQFTLAAKIDISTNFLADIEAGNTWISSLTLVKLAEVFEIKPYELFMPESERNTSGGQALLVDRAFNDLTIALLDSFEKTVKRVKKVYAG